MQTLFRDRLRKERIVKLVGALSYIKCYANVYGRRPSFSLTACFVCANKSVSSHVVLIEESECPFSSFCSQNTFLLFDFLTALCL